MPEKMPKAKMPTRLRPDEQARDRRLRKPREIRQGLVGNVKVLRRHFTEPIPYRESPGNSRLRQTDKTAEGHIQVMHLGRLYRRFVGFAPVSQGMHRPARTSSRISKIGYQNDILKPGAHFFAMAIMCSPVKSAPFQNCHALI